MRRSDEEIRLSKQLIRKFSNLEILRIGKHIALDEQFFRYLKAAELRIASSCLEQQSDAELSSECKDFDAPEWIWWIQSRLCD